MANVNAPFGFVPLRTMDGAAAIPSNEYTIASGLAENFGRGALVKMTGTGSNISLAGTTDQCVGVFWGVRYTDSDGKIVFRKNWVSGTVTSDAKAVVYDNPNIVFLAMCDTLAAGDVGALADHAQGGVKAKYNTSLAEVDVSAGTATTGMQIQILRLYDEPGNALGAYAKVECRIFQHALGGEAGAGV